MEGFYKMEYIRIILKIAMWILIIGFGCNFVMQSISYSFYKSAKHINDIENTPVKIHINDNLTGYGYNLDAGLNDIIIFFGGSNYIAYNSVGKFSKYFDCSFVSADYYGTQDSKGKMNLKTMQQTAINLYEWVREQYPGRRVTVIGHSYGTGMAAYLASVRACDTLVLLSAFRDISDLYNKIIPIFWGPAKVFISNNINIASYAESTTCKTYIIGSDADNTLNEDLQRKVYGLYKNAELKIFNDIEHENYFTDKQVIDYIKEIIE